MDDKNLKFGKRLRNWLSSLSLERRTTVLSVHDADFMSNLSKLWYLSSSSQSRLDSTAIAVLDSKTETGEGEFSFYSKPASPPPRHGYIQGK